MSDWPSIIGPPCVTITPWSLESISLGLSAGLNEGLTGGTAFPTSAVWVAANRAIFVPFSLGQQITVVKLFTINGATPNNNIDIGIYSDDYTRLTSSGSTAQSGNNVAQEFDITDISIGPGKFFLAMAMDGVSGTMFKVATSLGRYRLLGVLEQGTAFPLPATASPVALSTAYVPLFGLTTRTVV